MFEQVRYRGPSLGELHDQYTKQRRIDQAAPIRSAHEVRIEAPTARVWDLLSDPTGWSAIDPAIHDVRLDAEVDVDVRFVWRNGNTRLHSRFAVVDPQREISWTGSVMGSRAVHRHILTPEADSVTLLRSEESMAGALVGLFYDSTKLHAQLVHWLSAVKAAAERPLATCQADPGSGTDGE